MPAAELNGHAPTGDVARVTDMLTEPLTDGYVPSLPLWANYITDALPQIWLLRDIELMIIHPIVKNALEYFKSGIAGAEFWGGPNPQNPTDPIGLPVCADNPEVDLFVREQAQLFWDRGVPQVQNGYEYGWLGLENLYVADDGVKLRWDNARHFSPRDTFLLTQDTQPVGVRVKSIKRDKRGNVDMWLATEDIPAKALWYAHMPRWQQHYGRSQLLGAWRPWRRLAWKDAAETITDGGIYRFAYGGVVVRFPNEDLQTNQDGVPATTLDSQGRPRRYARDVARQIAEWFKAGAGIGLPSEKYPSEQGGGDKWALELPKQVLSVEGLIRYIQYLCDEIYYGIHIPPEILKASETGSGYSGRSIPIEAFLMMQQRIADQILLMFTTQVLRPLVRWNFGPDIKFNIAVKPLLVTKRAMQAGPGGTPGGMETRTMPPEGTARPGMPKQPEGNPTGGENNGWGAPFSLNYLSAIEKARKIAERIRQREAA